MSHIKKVAAYILAGLVIVLTLLAILAIWEVIPYEAIFQKSMTSLFVIFVASVVILFIFAVVIRDHSSNRPKEKE